MKRSTTHHRLLDFLRLWQAELLQNRLPVAGNFQKARSWQQQLLSGLLDKMSEFDPALLGTTTGSCILDVGEGLGHEVALDAFISPQGVTSENAGFYLSFRPGQSFIGLGYLANTFINGLAVHREKRLNGEELDYMLYFLTTYCDFQLLAGKKPGDIPAKSRLLNLRLEAIDTQPWFLFKYIPHEELLDSQLESWLLQQYRLLLSYGQYLNRALDFYAHYSLDMLEEEAEC